VPQVIIYFAGIRTGDLLKPTVTQPLWRRIWILAGIQQVRFL